MTNIIRKKDAEYHSNLSAVNLHWSMKWAHLFLMDVVEGPTYNHHHLLANSIIVYSWNRMLNCRSLCLCFTPLFDIFIAKENVIAIMIPLLTQCLLHLIRAESTPFDWLILPSYLSTMLWSWSNCLILSVSFLWLMSRPPAPLMLECVGFLMTLFTETDCDLGSVSCHAFLFIFISLCVRLPCLVWLIINITEWPSCYQ